MTIEIKLVHTNICIRWGCTVCGGRTERVGVLAEGQNEHGVIRVCERCLEAGDIDRKLANTAADLEAQAVMTRKLIGRLKVPSFTAWEDEMRRAELQGAQA